MSKQSTPIFMSDKKLVRITTVPISLEKLLENQLNFMKDNFEVIAVSSDKERLEKFGRENNLRTQHIELTRQITPVKDLIALWKMYRFLRREKPFIVHSHTPKAGTIGMLAAKFARVPHRLHTVAGLPLLEVTGKKRKLLNAVEKITYWAANRVYPNSFGLKEIIIDLKFCKPSKLTVIANGSSNGINTDYFDPELFHSGNDQFRESLNIQKGDLVFIFVGRLVGDKGINELISAFTKFTTKAENVKLLLVGELESELDPLTDNTLFEIQHNPNIISVGFQADVRPYFSIADVLAFPSYREGFPNVVMQAGAMGLPCIVSDINGCNEIIQNGINGIIIPVKNESTLLDAIIAMSGNQDLRKKLGQNSRKMIVSGYSQKIVWNAILKEYQDMLRDNKN